MTGFQSFDDPAGGSDHPARLTALREQMRAEGLDAFIVPQTDPHQGEYIADSDARLAWLTGFTGSAGFAIVTDRQAGVFIDGRYRLQVKSQVYPAYFTPVPWPETKQADWLGKALPEGGVVGFDPWLHTRKEVNTLNKSLKGTELRPVANLIDAIWHDRPAPPVGPARAHDDSLAGENAAEKCARLADELRRNDQTAAFLSLPDSISWLLNIRGTDIPKNPVVQSFAILSDSGHVELFADPAKFSDDLRAHLGNNVTIHPPDMLGRALADLKGPVRVDPATAPDAVFRLLEKAGTEIAQAPDPAIMPKARKNPAELSGMRAAHLRDGVAMVRFLAWLDSRDPETLTEIDVVRQLEKFRRDEGIIDVSFDTICGSGPNGAIVHYRVTKATNRRLARGELLLVDSGGQYPDGTTDITRTVALGPPPEGAIAAYTAVLRGMIAISRVRFPKGVTGAHLDALARQHLWATGLDYDHGTGHGVGAALCVHEGPARISRISDIPLEPGMILSNEPGYYREGAFGIRIENLICVTETQAKPGRQLYGFETLTLCPIDTRMIDRGALSRDEVEWLDRYHQTVWRELSPLLDEPAQNWLKGATAAIGG